VLRIKFCGGRKFRAPKSPTSCSCKKLCKISSNETNSEENWISGTVFRITSNGFGTFRDEHNSPTIGIMPFMVKEYNLKVDQKIEVITRPSSDGLKTYMKEINI
jgi:hypothetical protein